MKYSLAILLCFACGLGLSYGGVLPAFLTHSQMSTYSLWALIFFVGFSLGTDKESVQVLKSINYKILLVPCCVVLGSYLGALAVYFFSSELELNELVAVAFGFGYYSLSSVMIADLHSAELGTVALLSNIIRELITLILAPVLVKLFGRLAPIVSGGATSMDTCLPVIVQYSGRSYALVAVFSGMLLTILVPLLVGLVL